MGNVCANCGKGLVHGRQSSHHRGVAGKRWKKRAQVTLRVFKPNLQIVSATIGGVKEQMKLCTDCVSRFKIEGKISNSKVASV